MRRGQQGLTLIGFVVVLAVMGCFAYVAMRVIPMYTEFYQIKKSIASAVKEPGVETWDSRGLADKVSRHFEIGYVYSIEPKDVKRTIVNHHAVLSVDYEVRKPLFGNIFLVGHFVDSESASDTVAGDK